MDASEILLTEKIKESVLRRGAAVKRGFIRYLSVSKTLNCGVMEDPSNSKAMLQAFLLVKATWAQVVL